MDNERVVLLFYVYIFPLWDNELVSEMLHWQQTTAELLTLSGRIRVASEGLNVNISGSRKDIEQYCKLLLEWNNKAIKEIDFKITTTLSQNEFRGLKVWQVSEICALGAKIPPDSVGGRHILPEDFHNIIKESVEKKDNNVILLDARNLYESRVGRFDSKNKDSADSTIEKESIQFVAPPTSSFSELPLMLDNLEDDVGDLEGKTVLMYCTGGVRCERASQYLRLKHPKVSI